MTIACEAGDATPIGLDEFLARLGETGFDCDDEAAYVALAPLLGALGRNPTFLGDLMISELERRAARQERENDYGPQVLLLHRGPGWFVRANIWPDPADALYRASGPARFFYGVPHDHNFCFLTCGYFGPGYWSDYYEVDHDALAGVPGEAAGLRFVERSRLAEGRLLFYRAHVDVHDQHPPDATSISLNIAQGSAGRAFLDQHRYDPDRDLIAGQLAYSPTEALIALLPHLGGPEGLDLLDHLARRHPSDRVRFGAIQARASASGGTAGHALLERAAGDGNRTIAGLARVRLEERERATGWGGRS